MPTAGFETAVQEGERPQTYVLDRAATAINDMDTKKGKISYLCRE